MSDGTKKTQLAIVTGASAGIGAAMAKQLAAREYRVLAVARRADRLAALEAASGGAIVALSQDLTVDGAVERVAARAAELGGADLLVNNAGFGSFGPFWTCSRQTITNMLRLNVLTGVELAHHVLPGMIQRKRGGVIIVTSSAGMYPTPNLAAYGGSKAFLLLWGEALAIELRGTGVRALVVCPGPTATEFGEVAGMSEMLEKAPGIMQPEAVAKAVLQAWDRGRVLTVPGASNWLMSAIFQRLPRGVTRSLAASLFKGPAKS